MLDNLSYPSEPEPTTPELMRAALSYARRGVPVFPCKPGGKTPLTPNGHLAATTDEQQIRRWWTSWPAANIGIPTGERSGLLVIDVDPRHGGDTSLAVLEAEHGQIPHTTTVRTGSGGMHVYLRYPPGSNIRNSAGKLGSGLDVRGEGGYVIAPQSHTTGPYEWLERVPLTAPPEWLMEALRAPSRAAGDPTAAKIRTKDGQVPTSKQGMPPSEATGGRLSAVADEGRGIGPGPIPDGGRNTGLTRIAGRLRAWGYDGPELLAELERINAERCSPPLPAGEVLKIARSAERWPVGDAAGRALPETIDALRRISRDLLNNREWRGVGGKTERSIVAALVMLAKKCGELVPAGVRIEVSFRDLALLAAVPLRTVTRAISRLKLKRGVLRADNFNRSPEESGALVLLHPPGQTDHTPHHGQGPSGGAEWVGVDTLTTPRLRNSAPGILRLGKTGEAVVDHLVASSAGSIDVPELAALMGSCRPGSVRYLKRHIIPRLVEAGIVALAGDVLALTADWRGNLDRERERAGEIERYRLDVRQYDDDRLRHTVKLLARRRWSEEPIAEHVGISVERVRQILKRAESVPSREEKEEAPEPSGTPTAPLRSPKEPVENRVRVTHNTRRASILDRAGGAERSGAEPKGGSVEVDLLDLGLEEEPEDRCRAGTAALSPLAVAVRDYLDANPQDRHQPPGWIGNTLWCCDLYPGKPTPAEIRAAMGELAGERAA